ncbi:MAG: hypothetical protein HQK91_03895 [Nitrospirae bacterium]|nr:hypothetical protein [Nitrospirota bacterium]
MSRYRKIQVSIWNDDKFPFLDCDTQLVFFHLLTTPLSNSIGIFKISDKALSEELRMPFKRYKKAFRNLEKIGMVKYDETAQLIYLPSFLKHNPPDNPNVLSAWSYLFHELPKSVLKTKYFEELYMFVEKLGIGFRERFKERFGIPSNISPIVDNNLFNSTISSTECPYIQGVNVNDDKLNTEQTSKKQLHLEYVWLTSLEFQNLIEKNGLELTHSMISRLNSYIGSKGAKYKSHYYTILSWIDHDKKSTSTSKSFINKSENNDRELKRFLSYSESDNPLKEAVSQTPIEITHD